MNEHQTLYLKLPARFLPYLTHCCLFPAFTMRHAFTNRLIKPIVIIPDHQYSFVINQDSTGS